MKVILIRGNTSSPVEWISATAEDKQWFEDNKVIVTVTESVGGKDVRFAGADCGVKDENGDAVCSEVMHGNDWYLTMEQLRHKCENVMEQYND
jgi:hypothetical protein